jgi:hypothetical protein
MTAREKAHKLLDELPESEIGPIVEIMVLRGMGKQSETTRRGGGEESGEPVTVGLPESWKTFDDGTPQPDWTALIRADRDHGH